MGRHTLKARVAVAIATVALMAPAAAVADHSVLQAFQSAGARGEAAMSVAPVGAAQATSLESMRRTPGSLELVGHDPLLGRGMNAAPAIHGDYAYVGSRTDGTHLNAGVLVVNIADPSKPAVVGQIGQPHEGNVGETSRELRVWPEQKLLMVLNHGCSSLIHRCAGAEAGTVRSTIRFYDIAGANAANPQLVSTFFPSRTRAQIPHEFFLGTTRDVAAGRSSTTRTRTPRTRS